jgi:hypothetical protein
LGIAALAGNPNAKIMPRISAMFQARQGNEMHDWELEIATYHNPDRSGSAISFKEKEML